MASKQSDKDMEKHPVTQQESLNIDDKLADLSCPFTWKNIYITHKFDDEELLLKEEEEDFQLVLDTEEYFPETVLIFHLMKAYESTIKNDSPSAMERINKAERSFADIIQRGTLKNVENVLQHLFIGTKCHVLKNLGRLTEVAQLLEGVYDIKDMNETELAMLMGSQCSARLLYVSDNFMGIVCAKKAIKREPDNGKWHFLLAKNYRELRRWQHPLGQLPDEDETSAFKEAYRLDPNVLFGVSLAQLYRESWENTMANEIYKEVCSLQPTSCIIRYELALGFIRTKEHDLAKECLDYIAERMPDSSRYTHYMGIFHEKCSNDLKAALPYYKSTTENLNWTAEWQYISCRKRVEPDWNPLPYMLGLSEKYKRVRDHFHQDVNIQIGSYYLFEMCDVLSACLYLTEAIEIDPHNRRLRDHRMLFRQSGRVNIYRVLAEEIEFTLRTSTSVNGGEIAVLKDTLERCHKNRKNKSPPAFYRAQEPRPQLAGRYGNYDQGSSSHAETNWRTERSASPSRAFARDYPRKNSDGPNSLQRTSGSSLERDYTSWRAEKQPIGDNQKEHELSNRFGDRQDSVFANLARSGGNSPAGSSCPRKENDANASCSLEKTVKGFHL